VTCAWTFTGFSAFEKREYPKHCFVWNTLLYF